MRIGIYTPYLETLSGGEKYMLSIASYLAQKHEVTLFWDSKEAEIREKARTKLGIDLQKVIFAKNIFASHVSFVTRFIASMQYDYIIYLSDGSIPLVSPKLIIHFQFPVEQVKRPQGFTRFKVSRIQSIICNSLFTKQYIDTKFGVNSTILYPPISVSSPSVSVEKEAMILHVGRVSVEQGANFKKQDMLIEAFKEMVKEKKTSWEFHLVLGVDERNKEEELRLRKLAEGFPIEFHVNISHDALQKLYQKAQIYWHASGFEEDLASHPEKAEHFGMTTAEAMTYGVVPVVINQGGQKEIVDDGKNGYVWDTKGELIDRTLRLMTDLSLRGNFSRNAREKAKLFSQEQFFAKLDTMIV